MAESLYDAFGVESPNADTRKIPLDKVVPLGACDEAKPDPGFVFDYASLRRALKNIGERKPTWCWGPSGCGKTEFYVQIAARLKRPCRVISFGEESSIRELLGSFELAPAEGGAMQTRFVHGQLTRAILEPYAIIVLDEFNMAPPGVAAQLNRLFEEGSIVIPETGERIQMAEGAVLVVTANTPGGADELGIYAGSQVQNGATRSRFAGLRRTYLPAEQERQILLRAFPALDQVVTLAEQSKSTSAVMVDTANACRMLVDEGQVSLPFTVRNLKEWARSTLLLKDVSEGFRDAYYDLLSPSEAVPVAEIYHKIIGVRLED